MKVDFWDVVRVNDTCKHSEIRGKLGYIRGIGEEESNPRRGIAVCFYDLEHLRSVPEEDLIPLGYKDDVARADYEEWTKTAPHLRVTRGGKIID